MSQLTSTLLDDPLSFAIVQDFSGGEDSFRRSTLIDDNQSQHLLNVIVRDNYEARTRAGADSIPTPSTVIGAGIANILGLRYFSTPALSQLLAAAATVSSPKFYKFEGNVWTDLSAGYTPTAANSRPTMEQGIDKVLICDGVNPVSYNGTNFTVLGTGTSTADVPVNATILCWHTGRMFASGRSNANDSIYVSNLLSFADGQWDWVNRSFRIGNGDGDAVVAMASMQGTTLCVLKSNSVWLVNTDPALDASFSTGIQGFSAAAVAANVSYGLGCVGRDAWCAYANDVLFMSQDGVRSVQRMQAAAAQWQLSAPLSQPIQPYILRINQNAWSGIVAKSYREFAFFFVPLDNSLVNNYVLVYNTRLQKWMGAWTNWMGTCVDVSRFLAQPRLVFGDNTGKVNQWKDNNSVMDDVTYLDNAVGYPTQIWTKSWQFGELVTNKTGWNLISRFTNGTASVTFTWVCDNVVANTWLGSFEPTGDILGIGLLPFLLQSTAPSTMDEGVRGLPDFQEAYLRLETTAGWFFLRSVTASAFINPLTEV